MLCATALVMIAACGGGSSPTDTEFDINQGTTYQEVFDTLTTAEQECIRGELDDEHFDSPSEWTVLGEVALSDLGMAATEEEWETAQATKAEWDASLYGCLPPETARGLILATMIGLFESEMVQEDLGPGFDVEFGNDEKECLQDWVRSIDPAALYTGEDGLAAVGATFGVISCVPDFLIAVAAQELGVEPEDLSDDERACVHQWARDIDTAALTADEYDPAAFEAGLGMLACFPDLFASETTQEREAPGEEFADVGPDDHADWYEDATVAAVDEPIEGAIEVLYDIDYFVFQAEAGVVYQIDVAPITMSDPYVALYDTFEELAYSDDYIDLAPRIQWEAPSSGTYYVAVEGYDLGTYTLTIATP